jgi:hypothetical protein
MIKPKRSAAQQVADEAERRTLNPIGSRQTIADSQATPEFQENLKRLKSERLEREARLNPKRKVCFELIDPSPRLAGPVRRTGCSDGGCRRSWEC